MKMNDMHCLIESQIYTGDAWNLTHVSFVDSCLCLEIYSNQIYARKNNSESISG